MSSGLRGERRGGGDDESQGFGGIDRDLALEGRGGIGGDRGRYGERSEGKGRGN